MVSLMPDDGKIELGPLSVQSEISLIKEISEIHRVDAYHSLSIEGYQVTAELIQKIESGDWDPGEDQTDAGQINAMAAKGYFKAFKAVKASIIKILKDEELPGSIIERDLQGWYRDLFSPFFSAKLLPLGRVTGYRSSQVYIQSSRYVPPPSTAVLDSMDVFFTLLREEKNAFVRAVLGHFMFTFIHPYMDGNGRIGRFLMNAMLISGDLPWAVIRSTERSSYMDALEQASNNHNIKPFAELVLKEMNSRNTPG